MPSIHLNMFYWICTQKTNDQWILFHHHREDRILFGVTPKLNSQSLVLSLLRNASHRMNLVLGRAWLDQISLAQFTFPGGLQLLIYLAIGVIVLLHWIPQFIFDIADLLKCPARGNGGLNSFHLPPFIYTSWTHFTQSKSCLVLICQAILPIAATFQTSRFWIPRPSFFLGIQTLVQPTLPGEEF